MERIRLCHRQQRAFRLDQRAGRSEPWFTSLDPPSHQQIGGLPYRRFKVSGSSMKPFPLSVPNMVLFPLSVPE